MRTKLFAAVLAMASVAGVGACTHDAGTTGGTTTPQPPAAAKWNGDDLSIVPKAWAIVAGIDWQRIHSSDLFNAFAAPKIEKVPELAMLRSTCGFDPLATVTSATLAVSQLQGDGDGELIIHGMPKAKVLACLPQVVAKLPPELKLAQQGDTWVAGTGSKSVALRFLTDDVALLAFGTVATSPGIDGLLQASGGAVTSSAGFTELHGKINTKAAVWFIANLGAKPMPEMQGAQLAYGSLDVSDSASVDVRMRFDAEANAQAFASMAKAQGAQVAAMMFDKFDVVADGKEVAVSVAASRAKLATVMMMMGGGGGGGPSPTP
jgi:hypothetical protein